MSENSELPLVSVPRSAQRPRGSSSSPALPRRTDKCRRHCGRRVNPSLDRDGVPYETCCRACALGMGRHDPGCVEGQDAPQYADHEVSTAVGIALSSLCGDILGSAVLGWSTDQIHSEFPRGYQSFQRTAQGYGAYTDATQMSLALMISLRDFQSSNAKDAARWYALLYEKWRGYSPNAANTLEMLRQGRLSYKESGTWILPDGSHGNGGAVRIAPVGFVYRHSDNATLRDAVTKALMCTHVHPDGIDAAHVQASAVAILSRYRIKFEGGDTESDDIKPKDFLLRLRALSQAEDMGKKLDVLAEAFDRWNSEGPSVECFQETVAQVSSPFQAKGTEATACAVWVMCTHWEHPVEAIIEAVGCGGATNAIGSMVGALVGARHGWHWIPVGWFNNIENKQHGRDDIMAVAAQLTLLPTPSPI